MKLDADEVGRLLVRLVGDPSSFVRACEQSAQAAQQTAARVQEQANRIEGFGAAVKGFAASALGALAGFGVASSLGAAFSVFAEGEKTLLALKAAVEANGGAVDAAVAKYQGLAAQVAKQTLMTKGSVLELARQAETFGLQGDAAARAVRGAVALAGGNADLAQSMLAGTAAMERGNFSYLQRMLRIRDVKGQTELYDAIQKRMTSGMKQAEAAAGSAWGQVQKLGRSFVGLTRDVGELVATAIQPFVAGLQKAFDWFQDLDPAVKKAAVAVVAALGAVAGFGPALSALAPVFSVLKYGFAILAGPWGVALAAAGVAIGIVVERLGGLQKTFDLIKTAGGAAWKYVQTRAAEFWTWLRPVLLAGASLAQTAWGMISDGAVWLWGVIRDAFTRGWAWVVAQWDRITGGLTWDDVRAGVVDALIAAEFALRNFGRVAELVWTGVELSAVQALNSILNNIYTILAGPVILGYLAIAYTNWQKVFKAIWEFTKEVFVNMTYNVGTFFSKLWDSLKGVHVDWSAIWQPIANDITISLSGLKSETLDRLEKQLREQFNQQKGALGQDFEAFRQAKLAEFGRGWDTVNKLVQQNDPAKKQQEHWAAAAREVGKFDVALTGSAEAISRMQAQADKWQDDKGKRAAGVAGAPRVEAAVAGGAEGGGRQAQWLQQMAEGIRQLVEQGSRQEKKPALEVEPAGLT